MSISMSEKRGAGELRHPVEVYGIQYTDDGSGGQDKRWSLLFTIYCAIKSLSASEPYSDNAAGRIRSQDNFEFVTWFRDDIVVTQKLVWEGRSYNISDVDNMNLNRKFLRIKATTGVEQ